MSSTSDQLGKEAKEVTEDLQKMGGTLRDAAQKKLGQVTQSLGMLRAGAQQGPRHRMCVRGIRPAKTANVRIARGRRRSVVGLLLESGERPFP